MPCPVAETYANEFGKRYYQLPMYKLDVIGTDPYDAANFNRRLVYTGPLRHSLADERKSGIGEALLMTTSAVLEREMEHQHIPAEHRPRHDRIPEERFPRSFGLSSSAIGRILGSAALSAQWLRAKSVSALEPGL